MKKQFITIIDETAQLFDTIFFSAGRIDCQLEMDPQDLAETVGAAFVDITTGQNPCHLSMTVNMKTGQRMNDLWPANSWWSLLGSNQ